MDVNWLGNKELPDGSVNWAIFHQNKDLPPLDPLITTLVWTKGPLENLSGIGQLGNLRVLHLNGNRLSQLPPEFAQLQLLKVCDLGGNQFVYFPEVLLCLDLSHLYLNSNRLKRLPRLDKLNGLRVLSLAENRLTRLPKGFTSVSDRCVDLSGNPVVEFAQVPKSSALMYLENFVSPFAIFYYKSLPTEVVNSNWFTPDYKSIK